ncbi:unnamed protein product [Mytilus coruscus]|uniref:Uncharacterized protein n=1 Tax=Mytilus coruscus TaxID=42192 RepID=A0A6J8B2H9_MYTCO|nr:unnamed protein product [Mytilus coruscus]
MNSYDIDCRILGKTKTFYHCCRALDLLKRKCEAHRIAEFTTATWKHSTNGYEEITSATWEQSKFQKSESYIYIGCSGLLAIVVFILIAYICYTKTRKEKAWDNVESKDNNESGHKEKSVVQWMSDKNHIDENEYYEIDDSFLCDIRTKTHEENKMDTDKDDDNNQSIKTDVNEDYLNLYQPIISMEVDVHQYSSIKNQEEHSTTSIEDQRDSGYLNPYHSLVRNMSEPKHEYTGLEKLEIGISEISKERKIVTIKMSSQ